MRTKNSCCRFYYCYSKFNVLKKNIPILQEISFLPKVFTMFQHKKLIVAVIKIRPFIFLVFMLLCL